MIITQFALESGLVLAWLTLKTNIISKKLHVFRIFLIETNTDTIQVQECIFDKKEQNKQKHKMPSILSSHLVPLFQIT